MNLGAVSAESGRLSEAIERFGKASRTLRLLQASRLHAICSCFLAMTEARAGFQEYAFEHFENAMNYKATARDEEVLALREVCCVCLRGPDSDPTLESQGQLHDRIAASDVSHQSIIVRAALRELRMHIRTARPSSITVTANEPLSAGIHLVIKTRERCIEFSDGRILNLAGRGQLWRVAEALGQTAQRDAAKTLSVAELFEHAWPDTQIRLDAAARRVYWAIHALRKLGLDGILVRRDEGYLLSASSVRFQQSDDRATA